MSTYTNQLDVWGGNSLQELLAHHPGLDHSDPNSVRFDLDEPLLMVGALAGQTWRNPPVDWIVSVDFQRADRDTRVIQDQQQAELFGPILANESVTTAVLAHQDMWVVARRENGQITVTTLPEATGHTLTTELRAFFDNNGIDYDMADLGRI